MLTYLFQRAVAHIALVFSSLSLLGGLSGLKSRQRTFSVVIYYLHCVSWDLETIYVLHY